ncbi:MAG: hypothetical protein QM723_19640 [Myxococcaceae bacterium]
MRQLLAAAALLLCACPEDPDEILHFSGTVTRSDAVTPLDGVKVALLRSSDGNCTDEQPWHEATTADGGHWSLDFFRGEIQPGYISNDTAGLTRRCVTTHAQFTSGADTNFISGSFDPLTVAPVMFEWQTPIALDGGVVVFTPLVPPEKLAEIDAAETLYENGIQHEVQVKVGGRQIWKSSDLRYDFSNIQSTPDITPTVRVPMNVPDRVIEDFDAELDLVARANRKLSYPSSSVETTHDTPVQVNHLPANVLKVKHTGVPLTRGLSCAPLASPCPLTDGVLDPIDFDAGVNGFVFDLRSPSKVEWIVLRDANVDLASLTPQLDLMDDAGTVIESLQPQEIPPDDDLGVYLLDWRKFANGPQVLTSAPIVQWSVDGGVPASSVRLTFGAPVTRASELSLFAP